MDNAMRILVIGNLPPYVLGGAENQVARLVEAWAELGHHVEVAGHRIPDGWIDLGNARIRTHRIAVLDHLGRGGRATSYFGSLARLMARIHRDFDVIYSRGLGDGAISMCILKALGLVNLPLVACPINARGAGDVHFIRSIPGWRWIVGAINRHCEAVNIIAPAIESDLTELGIQGPRLSRIPNGIPLLPPVEHTAVSPVRRLVWTGRFSPQKGLDLLLPSLRRMADEGRSFRLDLIGDGPDRDLLFEQCRELGLEGHVFFIGQLDKCAIRNRLAKADLFVLPSRYEGMSNSALEAMEAGLPVLITRCGGIDTYLDAKMGWVCNPEDPFELDVVLRRMFETPEEALLAMGRRARTCVEREFEIGAIGRRNLSLLAQVAGVQEQI